MNLKPIHATIAQTGREMALTHTERVTKCCGRGEGNSPWCCCESLAVLEMCKSLIVIPSAWLCLPPACLDWLSTHGNLCWGGADPHHRTHEAGQPRRRFTISSARCEIEAPSPGLIRSAACYPHSIFQQNNHKAMERCGSNERRR